MIKLFQPKTYYHKVVLTYISGFTRTKYSGDDAKVAAQEFDTAKEKWITGKSTIWLGEWYRNGELHKHF